MPDIAPGFMVVHGNRLETLCALVLEWLRAHPLAPLEDEVVLVQSNGVAQWLRLAMAREPAQGGLGVAAAVQTLLPQRFVWQAWRAVLGPGQVPREAAFDAERLQWRLMRLLPTLLDDEACAPLRRYLREDPELRKRHQLCQRLAALFEQYQVHRADWLQGWAAGDDTLADARGEPRPLPDEQRWQPLLWRALQADAGAALSASSRAAVHRRFLAAARDGRGERPPGLPRRVVVFGLSSLPAQSLQTLAALGRWVQVLVCVHNPCRHDWSRIVPGHELLRAQRRRQAQRPGGAGNGAAAPADAATAPPSAADAAASAAPPAEGHPLLAAWGRQGRDLVRLLDEHDDRRAYEQRFAEIGRRVDCFEGVDDEAMGAGSGGDAATEVSAAAAVTGPHPLLRQLQDDILELRPLAETRARWPGVDAARDRSIRFHACHGPQREVEVLHDQLLDAFAADPTLRPRDVIVMVPDIAVYAPHVQAVFGLVGPDDPRHLPFSIADRGQRHHDPLAGALEHLLGLPQARLAVAEVLDLLEVPALRRRFGLDEDALPVLRRWLDDACVRWGLDAAHRQELGWDGAPALNSWEAGLQRLLLGYAAGAAGPWQGIEPADEAGGLEAAWLGPLDRLLRTLRAHRRELAQSAPPAAWALRLRALLADFFDASEAGDGYTLMRLETALQDWQDACAEAGLVEPLPLAVVREHWLAQLDAGGMGRPFLGGGIGFATLMPMRAVPFRIVALLGLNDGDYPRSPTPSDFDLMALEARPGDRSRREDDRYLFLEALLSARERLHLSWVGRSIHDDEPRPPSVLLAQLRDHLAAGWRPAGDARAQAEAGSELLKQLTLQHPLQPFSPAYFTEAGDPRLSSHAHEWRAGLQAQAQAFGPSPLAGEGLGRVGSVEVSAPVPLSPDPSPARREGSPVPVPALARGQGSAVLPPTPPAGPLTLRLLAEFLKNPARSFLRHRLSIVLPEHDEAGDDDEPFALDGLDRWGLHERLIGLQQVALQGGGSPAERAQAAAQAVAEAIAGHTRAGRLPLGGFGVVAGRELAATQDDLRQRLQQALERWPQALPDEDIDHCASPWPDGESDRPADPPHGSAVDESLRTVDLLQGLRADASGARARVLPLASALLDNKGRARVPKLIAPWVEHLAGHLAGRPLSTVVVGVDGDVTLPTLDPAQARALWAALAAAWQAGRGRPLPLAPRAACAWLAAQAKGGDGAEARAFADARKAYEHHDPRHQQFAEVRGDPCLARAFPDFDPLWSEGEFAHWAQALLQPLWAAVAMQGGEASAP